MAVDWHLYYNLFKIPTFVHQTNTCCLLMGRIYFLLTLVSEVQLQFWQQLTEMNFAELLYQFSRMRLGSIVSWFFDYYVEFSDGFLESWWFLVSFVCFCLPSFLLPHTPLQQAFLEGPQKGKHKAISSSVPSSVSSAMTFSCFCALLAFAMWKSSITSGIYQTQVTFLNKQTSLISSSKEKMKIWKSTREQELLWKKGYIDS